MKLAAMALASAFALSSTCAFAHTVRHKSNVKTPYIGMLRRQSSRIRNMAVQTEISAERGTAMCGATWAPTMGP